MPLNSGIQPNTTPIVRHGVISPSTGSPQIISKLKDSDASVQQQEPIREQMIRVEVKVFETTDETITVECSDSSSVRTFFQNLIVNHIAGQQSGKLNEAAINQIMNMYSLLVVRQMVYSTYNRWIVDLDIPMRHVQLCSRSVIHCISKSKKVNIIVTDTKQMSLMVDETITVGQLIVEIAKKLMVKAPFEQDFGLRHLRTIPKMKSNDFILMNNNMSEFCRWLDPNLSLREQNVDIVNDKVAFCRKYHCYFDEMMRNAEMMFELISMTFFEARSKFLCGDVVLDIDSTDDNVSPEMLEILSLEAVGAGYSSAALNKDPDLLKFLIPIKKMDVISRSKNLSKIKKDIIQAITLKTGKSNENIAQTRFIEAIARNEFYKLDIYPAISKGSTEVEVYLGIGPTAFYVLNATTRNIISKFEYEYITHFASSVASFHLITVINGKQSKHEFETRYGKQVEIAIEGNMLNARTLKKNAPEPTLSSFSTPTNEYERLLKNSALVKEAQEELVEIERKMFNTGSLKNLNSNSEVDTTVHPLPHVNNIEYETMEKLVKMEADLRTLSIQKNILKAYLDSTRVGRYSRSVQTMKEQIDELIRQIHENGQNPQKVKDLVQNLEQVISSQLSSFINYENYLHSKAELLLRKREMVLKQNGEKGTEPAPFHEQSLSQSQQAVTATKLYQKPLSQQTNHIQSQIQAQQTQEIATSKIEDHQLSDQAQTQTLIKITPRAQTQQNQSQVQQQQQELSQSQKASALPNLRPRTHSQQTNQVQSQQTTQQNQSQTQQNHVQQIQHQSEPNQSQKVPMSPKLTPRAQTQQINQVHPQQTTQQNQSQAQQRQQELSQSQKASAVPKLPPRIHPRQSNQVQTPVQTQAQSQQSAMSSQIPKTSGAPKLPLRNNPPSSQVLPQQTTQQNQIQTQQSQQQQPQLSSLQQSRILQQQQQQSQQLQSPLSPKLLPSQQELLQLQHQLQNQNEQPQNDEQPKRKSLLNRVSLFTQKPSDNTQSATPGSGGGNMVSKLAGRFEKK
jgi:hypothetical protein